MRTRLSVVPVPALFGVVSLVVILLVASVLQGALRSMIQDRAVDDAVRAAEFAAQVGLRPVLPDSFVGVVLEGQAREQVDHAVASGLEAELLVRVKIFDRDGLVIYSDEPGVMGTSVGMKGLLREVRDSGASQYKFVDTSLSEHEHERGLGRLMEVFVPLTDTSGEVQGIAELYVPFDPVEAGIRADTERLLLLLLGGLAFLWLALFQLVQMVSRRLQDEVSRNLHQALHDSLTGLPNRVMLFDRIEAAVARAAPERAVSAAVLLLDLDHFKEVNDTLGHHNGDRLLVEVAARLRGVLRDGEVLARLGGDEFAVLAPAAGDPADADALAHRLVHVLRAPVDLDGLQVSVGVSVGIALHPADADTPQLLLQRADVAMYLAKQHHGHVARYSTDADHYSTDRLAVLGDLRHALERDELELFFQPKADTRTGEIRGLEALLRWHHPQRGLVPPEVFIPLAEQTGLIDDVTPFVLRHALAACSSWSAAGHPVSVSVNVSVRNLLDERFPEVVARLLDDSGVPPERLVLELTESALMTDPATALTVLHALRALGVFLSIDDYGSGYSSLAYIQQLPVQELKIDRQFVRLLAECDKDRAIVRSTVDLARNLGLLVVAEGVEDQASWDTLTELSCDHIQGYFLARPMPSGDVLDWLDGYDPGPRDRPRLIPLQATGV